MIKSILKIIECFATWFFCDKRAKRLEIAERDAIDKAVHTHDKDTVNAKLKDLLCFVGGISLAIATLSGCTTVKYVASDRTVEPMILEDGRLGWFVPNAVMSEMLNKLDTTQSK